MTKTKIALAAVLFAATSSAAFAQGNHANRHAGAAPQSAPVLQQRNVSLPAPRESNYDGVNQFNATRFDHASSPFAGGDPLISIIFCWYCGSCIQPSISPPSP